METEEGSQELVIENLENLKDTTALVVTKIGKNFKIGITSEDKSNVSDMVSNIDSQVR